MDRHDILLFVVAYFSELLGTLSGFGSSTFFLPIAIQFENFRFVMVLTSILHCFGNVARLFLFREATDWKLFFRLMPPFVLMTALGAYLSTSFDRSYFEKALGIILILLSLVLFFKRWLPTKLGPRSALFLTSLSGFSTGLIGTGGALRGVALSVLNIKAVSFVFLSSAIDFGGDLIRTGIYLLNDYMDWNQWYYLPLLAISSYLGSLSGKFLINKMSSQLFQNIVIVFVLLSGILLCLEHA